MYVYSDFRSRSSNILPKDKIIMKKEHRKIDIFQDNNLERSISELKNSNFKKSEFLNIYQESKNSSNLITDNNLIYFPREVNYTQNQNKAKSNAQSKKFKISNAKNKNQKSTKIKKSLNKSKIDELIDKDPNTSTISNSPNLSYTLNYKKYLNEENKSYKLFTNVTLSEINKKRIKENISNHSAKKFTESVSTITNKKILLNPLGGFSEKSLDVEKKYEEFQEKIEKLYDINNKSALKPKKEIDLFFKKIPMKRFKDTKSNYSVNESLNESANSIKNLTNISNNSIVYSFDGNNEKILKINSNKKGIKANDNRFSYIGGNIRKEKNEKNIFKKKRIFTKIERSKVKFELVRVIEFPNKDLNIKMEEQEKLIEKNNKNSKHSKKTSSNNISKLTDLRNLNLNDQEFLFSNKEKAKAKEENKIKIINLSGGKNQISPLKKMDSMNIDLSFEEKRILNHKPETPIDIKNQYNEIFSIKKEGKFNYRETKTNKNMDEMFAKLYEIAKKDVGFYQYHNELNKSVIRDCKEKIHLWKNIIDFIFPKVFNNKIERKKHEEIKIDYSREYDEILQKFAKFSIKDFIKLSQKRGEKDEMENIQKKLKKRIFGNLFENDEQRRGNNSSQNSRNSRENDLNLDTVVEKKNKKYHIWESRLVRDINLKNNSEIPVEAYDANSFYTKKEKKDFKAISERIIKPNTLKNINDLKRNRLHKLNQLSENIERNNIIRELYKKKEILIYIPKENIDNVNISNIQNLTQIDEKTILPTNNQSNISNPTGFINSNNFFQNNDKEKEIISRKLDTTRNSPNYLKSMNKSLDLLAGEGFNYNLDSSSLRYLKTNNKTSNYLMNNFNYNNNKEFHLDNISKSKISIKGDMSKITFDNNNPLKNDKNFFNKRQTFSNKNFIENVHTKKLSQSGQIIMNNYNNPALKSQFNSYKNKNDNKSFNVVSPILINSFLEYEDI